MLRATSSPQRPTPRSSDIAQRLHQAAALDSQYDELEHARAELERARGRKVPPPPPASPRSRTLNRLLEVYTADIHSIPNFSQDNAAVALETLRIAIDQVLNEHTGAGDADSDAEGNALAPVAIAPFQSKKRLGFQDENRLALRGGTGPLALIKIAPLPLVGRTWNVAIMSASIQFNKAVEYEIKTELTVTSGSESSPGGSGGVLEASCVVRRRYRDFDQLRKMFDNEVAKSEFVLIPRLPPKSAKQVVTNSRADPNFVWDRRVALYFWLRYMSEHHAIRNSTLLRAFLWEPSRAIGDGATSEDMTPHAEKILWENALAHQQKVMEYRFGNSVVALTAMATHIRNMIGAYQRASSKASAVVAFDQSLGRSLSRASTAFAAWADFEKSAGQNYGFVGKFAGVLPAQDSNRVQQQQQQQQHGNAQQQAHETSVSGTVAEEALVSFAAANNGNIRFGGMGGVGGGASTGRSEMDKILVKDQVEVPVIESAFCDVRSVKAFQTLLHMWGDDILPRMEANLVDPKKASPYYEETKHRADNHGNRVACEWAELENLKRGMLRDGAMLLAMDQIRHAVAERKRWTQLQETICVQEVEISSLVALGDVSAPLMVSPSQHSHNDHESSSFSSSARSSPIDHLQQMRHHGSTGRVPSRNDNLHNFGDSPLLATVVTPPNQSINTDGSGGRLYSADVLDRNLEEAQATFQEHERGVDLRVPLTAKFKELDDSRNLNPFFSDDEE